MLELLPLLIEVLIAMAVGIIGYLLKKMIDHIDDKLQLILTNQQRQEVVIAEIEKDVEITTQITNKSEEEISCLTNKVHELDKNLSIVIQWKKYQEKV